MHIEFTGSIWHWHGPSPYFFVTVPPGESRELKAVVGIVSYGWGMLPVTARIGGTRWKTSLYPKDGAYVLPLKARVRAAEDLREGDAVTVRLEVLV